MKAYNFTEKLLDQMETALFLPVKGDEMVGGMFFINNKRQTVLVRFTRTFRLQ